MVAGSEKVACNLACAFCRERTGPVAVAHGPDTVLFTGGEPLLWPKVFSHMANELTNGRRVVLQTNGLLLVYPQFRQKLVALMKRGGVQLCLLLPALEEGTFDKAVSRPGAWALWREALTALARDSLPFGFSVPLGEQAFTPGQLADFLKRENITPTGLWLCLRQGNPPALAPQATAFAQALAPLGIPVRLHENTPLPPCVFDTPQDALLLLPPEKFAFHRHAKNRQKAPSCLSCVLDHGCPGIAPGLAGGAAALRPLKKRNLVADFDLQETFQREFDDNLLTFDMVQGHRGATPVHALLRVTFQCNHHCRFCWVNPHLAQPSPPLLGQKLQQAKAADVRAVTLTGGEPTLHRDLPALITQARSLGLEVYLQTHAMRLADPAHAQQLKEAGLDFVFVSLHGHEAAVSDAITGYVGGFDKTVAGTKNLLAIGVPVGVSHVIEPLNLPHLPRFANFIGSELPQAVVMLSMAQAVHEALLPRDVWPPYAQVGGPVKAFFDEARRLGVRVAGLSGQCGIPPCVVAGDETLFEDLVAVPPGDHPDFHKAPFCRECRFDAVCWGPRRGQVARHGFAGLTAIPGPPAHPRLSATPGQWRSPVDVARLSPKGYS